MTACLENHDQNHAVVATLPLGRNLEKIPVLRRKKTKKKLAKAGNRLKTADR